MRARQWMLCCALLAGLLPGARAHLLNMTEAQLHLDPATGSVTLTLQLDLLRSLGSPEAYLEFAQDLDNPAYRPLWANLASNVQLEQNNQQLPLQLKSAQPPAPFEAAAFLDPFQWPKVTVILVGSGYNPQLPLQTTFTRAFVFEEPIALTMSDGEKRMSRWLITEQTSPLFASAGAEPPQPAPTPDQYLSTFWVGFGHILPAGVDHLMFVLALLLVCRTVRQTVVLVTAFTVGHSLSLAVAGFKLVNVPPIVVEPLILLSISLYGLALLRNAEASSAHRFWPVLIVGLLHGLGFAAAFAELQWGTAPLWHLAAFNLGIEVAQLLFVFALYPVLVRYRASLTKPLAVLLVLAPLVLAAPLIS